MVIVCPSCATEYTLDPARLGPSGRNVRCATCRQTWLAKPGENLPVPGSLASETPPPPPARPAPVSRHQVRSAGRRPARIATGLVAATFLAILIAIVARTRLVAVVPESATLFAAMGLPVNLVGLTLGEVSSGLSEENGRSVLVTEGSIANLGGKDLRVPDIELTVESRAGHVLYSYPAKATRAELGPGETTRFKSQLASPPPDGTRVLVSFGRGGGRAMAAR